MRPLCSGKTSSQSEARDPKTQRRVVGRASPLSGSTGPDQGFLDITRAPSSAPGRGRARGPVRRNPNPQTTDHRARRQHESGSQSRFLSAISTTGDMPWFSQATSNARRPVPHLVPAGCIAPADGVGKATGSHELEVSQTGYDQVSPKICSKPARSSHQQILHDRHMEIIYFLDAQEAKWSNQH
jgi:hypothetical protein